ncbi:MAG: phenylalanine--tRNA ligase subunit beta [Candidatus Omnitrophica bacterium]|nr:phenylalanine--tRNA ligase subunit beta [Candidatus Omnitrophota bacterium]
MKVSLDWLHDYVSFRGDGAAMAEKLTLAGLEVKKIEERADLQDKVFETEITSNRPDWLSHIGVAREIAAVCHQKLKLPQIKKRASSKIAPKWTLQIQDREGCPYYTGIYLGGIKQVETPVLIRKRLEACGLRPINFIVDITNYVLLETGQPLHAFDADRLKGNKIVVRRAKPQEKFAAINENHYELYPEDIVISDTENPCALGGVMGGKESEIDSETKNIFLESAFFNPRFIRRTSRRLGLSSDSSYRFERRVDPQGVDFSRQRAVDLICHYACPETVGPVIRAGKKPGVKVRNLKLSAKELEGILGFKIPEKNVLNILTRLGFQIKRISKGAWRITLPSYRGDVSAPVDLVEEVARIYGYEKIPESLPSRPPLLDQDSFAQDLETRARQVLCGIGFHETITVSLISKNYLANPEILNKAISVQNPQNKDLCWMRPTFLPSFLQVIKRNVDFGSKQVLLYELSNLYQKPVRPSLASEKRVLGLALAGKWSLKNWVDAEREVTFYDLKGTLEHLFASLGIPKICYERSSHPLLKTHNSESLQTHGTTLGILGEVSAQEIKHWDFEGEVFYAEIFLEALASLGKKLTLVREIPKFPAMERDLAICVPESVPSGELEEEMRKLGGSLLTKIELFDLYRGGRVSPGHKNLAYRLTYQSYERTLLSEEIQSLHHKIANSLALKYQATFQ